MLSVTTSLVRVFNGAVFYTDGFVDFFTPPYMSPVSIVLDDSWKLWQS